MMSDSISAIIISKNQYPNPVIGNRVIQITPGYTSGYYYIWRGEECLGLGYNREIADLESLLHDQVNKMIERHKEVMNDKIQ